MTPRECCRRSRRVAAGCRGPRALLTPLVAACVLSAAPDAFAAGKSAAPVEKSTRSSRALDVPRSKGAALHVEVELGSLLLQGRSRTIEVPPQDFYVAELHNGEIVTVIDGAEKRRRAGDLWAVAAGQKMTVHIADKRQQNVLLRVFSVRAPR